MRHYHWSSQRPFGRKSPSLPSGSIAVGKYELTPTFILTVTRDGNRLFVQATGQPKFEVFAEGERDCFLKAVDAQVTFETEGEGRATGLILHQNGAHQPARRIE